MFEESLQQQIRDRFMYVDHCPYQGPRIFFENAGGALTLKSVVEVNTELAGIPDNQGRVVAAYHNIGGGLFIRPQEHLAPGTGNKKSTVFGLFNLCI